MEARGAAGGRAAGSCCPERETQEAEEEAATLERMRVGNMGADKMASAFLAHRQRQRSAAGQQRRRRWQRQEQTGSPARPHKESIGASVGATAPLSSTVHTPLPTGPGALLPSSWALGCMQDPVKLFSPHLGVVKAPRRIAISRIRNRNSAHGPS